MVTALIILMLIHGLIHLLAPAKRRNPSALPDLKRIPGRVEACFWLVCSLLFAAGAVALLLDVPYWWLPAGIAAVLSQVLIAGAWKEARWGTPPNIVILAAAIGGYGMWQFHESFRADVATQLEGLILPENDLLSEDDIAPLPAAVKAYIRSSGCIGKPRVHSFTTEISGQIRANESAPWIPFGSVQYNVVKNPARMFYMRARMYGLPVVGYHRFADGSAVMDVRLAGLFRVQYMDGHEMNRAETVTLLNDMCVMAPASLIDSAITWVAERGDTVEARYTYGANTITAWLIFGESGELIDFYSDDRYNYDAGMVMRWSTPISDRGEIGEVVLGRYAEALYHYPSGPSAYATFNMKSVEYNPAPQN